MKSTHNRLYFLGCQVDNIDMAALFNVIREWIASREPRRITVLNANKLWQMSRDERLREIMANSDVVLPEWAVVWGSRFLQLGILNFMPGIEVLKEFLPFAVDNGYRIYFLGASEETITKMMERIKLHYPGIEIAGYHHGYLQSAEIREEALEDIRRANPDVIFVGMGSPKQEYWMNEYQRDLEIPVAMGVGGSFDVLAGVKPDTPKWARGRGIEWLYRLAIDPRAYWKRYFITNPWFVWMVFRARCSTSFRD